MLENVIVYVKNTYNFIKSRFHNYLYSGRELENGLYLMEEMGNEPRTTGTVVEHRNHTATQAVTVHV